MNHISLWLSAMPSARLTLIGLRASSRIWRARTADVGPELLSEEGFADLVRRGDEGPVTMLNLLSFKADGGRERYAEYGEAVQPLLEGVGGRVVFQGRASPALLGEESWDLVLLDV